MSILNQSSEVWPGAYTEPVPVAFPPSVMQTPYGYITQADSATLTTNQDTKMKLSQVLPALQAGTTVFQNTPAGVITSVSTGAQWLPDIEIPAESEVVLQPPDGSQQLLKLVGTTLVPTSGAGTAFTLNRRAGVTTASIFGGQNLMLWGAVAFAAWWFLSKGKR